MEADYEITIIGGGIHGAGIAQAAAAAGYHTLVLEQEAVACATSSRSSKLIHGGLRYLETAQFSLVRESLHERHILQKIAPQLVRLVPFHIPIYNHNKRRPWQIRLGLSLYALLGQLKQETRFNTIPSIHWHKLDGLVTTGLLRVFRYCDGQTDDRLLTRAVMDSACSLGAKLECPAHFIAAEKINHGYQIEYRTGDRTITIGTTILVNAAGPWVNRIADTISPGPPQQAIDLFQGSHILIDAEITQGIYYVEAPQDQRAVFVMPYGKQTLVGTTESVYTGDPAEVRPLPEEVAYLQTALHHYFPQHPLVIINSYAGLRVLPKARGAAFHRSRSVLFKTDDPRRPNYIAIYGGKLTTYRATAARILRLIKTSLPTYQPVADTRQLQLPAVGGDNSSQDS